MDENRLHEKLDKIIDDVAEMKITQIKQQVILEHHVYRCDLLEENQATLKDETAKAFSSVRRDLEPLKTFKNYAIGAAKWTSLLITLAGVIIGILKLVSH